MDENQLLVDQPLGEKLIKKGFWLYFFSFLIAPAGYIIKVVISNSVSVADVGILYSIVGLITFLNVYNDLGLTESLQYFLPRYWINKQYNYIKTSIYISLFAQIFTAIIIALLLRFGAPWLAENYFHSDNAVIILKYFCFYFLGINLFQILQSIFFAFQNTLAYQFVDFIKMRSTVGFTFLFFLTGRQTIEWYSLNWVLGLGIGILIASIVFYKKYKKHLLQGHIVYDKTMFNEYIKYALWCFVGINIGALFGQIIQQLVVLILGAEQAGFYSNFLSLFMISGVLIGPIMGLIFPLVSELVIKKDYIKQKLLYSFFYTYFSVFSLLLAVLFIVLGPEIALILFGEKFVFSGILLSWAGILTVLINFVSFNFSVMAGMGKIRERVKILLISVGIVALVSLIGLSIIGIYGSLLALGVGYGLLFWLSFRLIYKNILFEVNWKFIIKNIFFFLIFGILCQLIKKYIFIFDDAMRLSNLFKMIGLCLFLFSVFIMINYEKILLLKKEILKIRNQKFL